MKPLLRRENPARFLACLSVATVLCLVGTAHGDYESDGNGYGKAERKGGVRVVTLADAGKTIHLRVGGYFDVHLPDSEPEVSWGSDAEENFRVEDGKPLHIWTLPQKRGDRGATGAKDGMDVFMYRAAKAGKQNLTFSYAAEGKKDRKATFHFVIDRK